MFSSHSRARSIFVALLSISCLFGIAQNSAFSFAKPESSTLEGERPCEETPTALEADAKVVRQLGGSECHSYEIAFPANQLLQIAVEQKGIDVTLSIYTEKGIKLSKVDRPNGSRGPETISLITSAESSYRLLIRSLEEVSARGEYELRLRSPRPPQYEDTVQIRAEQLLSEADALTSKSPYAAISKFNEATELWRSLGNDYEEALATYGAGYISKSTGDNQTAIDYFKRALSVFILLKNASGEAMVKAGMGWAYLNLADLDNSFESFQSAFELHRGEKSVRGEGIDLFGMGWVHALRGENQKALQKFADSLERRREVMDRKGEALTLTGIAKIESRLGRLDDALKNLNAALRILPSSDRYSEADILSNMGWVYKSLDEGDKAMSFFRAALAIRRDLNDLIGQATTRYGMSIIHRNYKRFDDAEMEIAQAVQIIESLRVKGSNEHQRLSYFASVQDYYEYYIGLLIEMDEHNPQAGHAARALHVSERARARGLLDLLAEARVDLRIGIDPDVLKHERSLNDKLNELAIQRRNSSGNTSGSGDPADKEIQQLRNELETVRAKIRGLNPRYAMITQFQPLTADAIQKRVLDANTLLLQYVLSEPRSFLIAVTRDDVTTYELPSRSEIESVARQFYDAVTVRNSQDPALVADEARRRIYEAEALAEDLAHELSRMLLAPVSRRLTKQRLAIVGPGALQFLPFAALPDPTTFASGTLQRAQAAHRRAPNKSAPLIENHEIIVLPSVTALSAIREDVSMRAAATKSVVVLADPVFDSRDGRVAQPSGGTTAPTGFARLISSRWEGEQIISLLRPNEGKLMVDFAANRRFALSGELGKFEIIHFATHALVDLEHPALSGIVLSLVDENGKSQNGFLSLDDIFKLRMPADLVVLSGCKTALGKDYAGEGFVGLTRAFMYAGASKIAVSLWQVTDKSTSELMIRFHRYMHGPKRLPAAAALRAAQLDLRKDSRWRSPYFWASFTLQGDWR